jgi:acrylyl-CoA reductase (NADPH)
VTLAGVDSVYCPKDKRIEAWGRLAAEIDLAQLDTIAQEIRLDDVIPAAHKLIEGRLRGRFVVNVNN